MHAADLLREHFIRTKTFRLDLLALSEFVKARDNGEIPDEGVLVNLFWEMWQPRLDPGGVEGLQENPPPLDSDIEDTLLEQLTRLERECRVPYEPDSDVRERLPSEVYEWVLQYVHVGAASALRRRKRDGLNEDVVKTLLEVSRILHLFGIKVHNETLDIGIIEASSGIVSLCGVKALVDRELAHVKRLDGKDKGAFAKAFDSFVSAEEVWDAVAWDDVGLQRQFLVEVFGEERLPVEEETRAAIRRSLPLYEPQEIVDRFEELRAQDKSDSWRRVARQCQRLALTLDDDLQEKTVLDGNREEVDWYGYWSRARGWAEDHLGPQELRDLRKADEEEGSEVRLKGYFFGESWEKIPAKARAHLISVDGTWLSKARGGAIWAVLNDLQVAAEAMCHTFIWETLRKSRSHQSLLRVLERSDSFQAPVASPTLLDYARLCRDQGFGKFVHGRGASTQEQRFLCKDLPRAFDCLRRLRNPAEHDPVRLFQREEVEPLVRLFLGIGRYGILTRLAEVGPKLSTRLNEHGSPR